MIDAKRHKGRIAIRTGGSLLRPGPDQLYVGNRNKSQLVVGATRQAETVKAQLADLVDDDELADIVRPALCFVDGDWSFFARPDVLDGVRVTWPKALYKVIAEPGPLDQERILELGSRLAERLVPA